MVLITLTHIRYPDLTDCCNRYFHLHAKLDFFIYFAQQSNKKKRSILQEHSISVPGVPDQETLGLYYLENIEGKEKQEDRSGPEGATQLQNIAIPQQAGFSVLPHKPLPVHALPDSYPSTTNPFR